ncbi:hypothetical protein Clacol_006175 [Clathrus columnatus]|uniref:Enoyl reductase (ER) domain-containing protein n=1 Tax=Clathrus columnatus TaxID=1419009 RepID=A0AAV5AE72_9AGAM|nr:hypothetical protein Clacol_006175 [Clathrus columnatus]
MTQQKALILPKKHGEFEVGLVDIPTPGPGELLVKIQSTALNPVDWKIQVIGFFVDESSYPFVLGTDSAGIVEAVGEGVTNFKVGDKVFHQGNFAHRNATFQQYTIVPAEITAKLPENLSYDQAASVPLGLATGATGFYNPIETGAGLGLTAPWEGGEGKYSDQGILIFGGASSVGQYSHNPPYAIAIQLAKLSGFNPIVTTASLHNTELLKSLGATHVIDRKADVVAEASKIFSEPPKIIYDAISLAPTQTAAWKILAKDGSLILVLPPTEGIKAGDDGKRLAHVYGNVFTQRKLGVSMYPNLTEYFASGKLKPNKVEVLPNGLAGIPDGLVRMQKDQVSGVKLIARPQETP